MDAGAKVTEAPILVDSVSKPPTTCYSNETFYTDSSDSFRTKCKSTANLLQKRRLRGATSYGQLNPYRPSHQYNQYASRFTLPSKNVMNDVTQKVMSAKLLRTKEYHSELAEAHLHINELITENRLLRTLQKRQEMALKKYEGTHAELPRLIRSHQEEVRILRAKVKQLRLQCSEKDRRLKDQDHELNMVKDQCKRLLRLSRDRALGEREKLKQQVEDLQETIKEQDTKIQTLTRKVMLEGKNYRHQINVERANYKTLEKELADALEDVARLEGVVELKEKYISTYMPQRHFRKGNSTDERHLNVSFGSSSRFSGLRHLRNEMELPSTISLQEEEEQILSGSTNTLLTSHHGSMESVRDHSYTKQKRTNVSMSSDYQQKRFPFSKAKICDVTDKLSKSDVKTDKKGKVNEHNALPFLTNTNTSNTASVAEHLGGDDPLFSVHKNMTTVGNHSPDEKQLSGNIHTSSHSGNGTVLSPLRRSRKNSKVFEDENKPSNGNSNESQSIQPPDDEKPSLAEKLISELYKESDLLSDQLGLQNLKQELDTAGQGNSLSNVPHSGGSKESNSAVVSRRGSSSPSRPGSKTRSTENLAGSGSDSKNISTVNQELLRSSDESRKHSLESEVSFGGDSNKSELSDSSNTAKTKLTQKGSASRKRLLVSEVSPSGSGNIGSPITEKKSERSAALKRGSSSSLEENILTNSAPESQTQSPTPGLDNFAKETTVNVTEKVALPDAETQREHTGSLASTYDDVKVRRNRLEEMSKKWNKIECDTLLEVAQTNVKQAETGTKKEETNEAEFKVQLDAAKKEKLLNALKEIDKNAKPHIGTLLKTERKVTGAVFPKKTLQGAASVHGSSSSNILLSNLQVGDKLHTSFSSTGQTTKAIKTSQDGPDFLKNFPPGKLQGDGRLKHSESFLSELFGVNPAEYEGGTVKSFEGHNNLVMSTLVKSISKSEIDASNHDLDIE